MCSHGHYAHPHDNECHCPFDVLGCAKQRKCCIVETNASYAAPRTIFEWRVCPKTAGTPNKFARALCQGGRAHIAHSIETHHLWCGICVRVLLLRFSAYFGCPQFKWVYLCVSMFAVRAVQRQMEKIIVYTAIRVPHFWMDASGAACPTCNIYMKCVRISLTPHNIIYHMCVERSMGFSGA